MVVKRRIKKWVIFLMFLVVLLIGCGITIMYLSSPVDKNDKETVEVVVESGSSSTQIGHLLKEKDLIRNELLFKVYLNFYNVGALKASTYKLNKSMDLMEVIKSLEAGNSYNPDEIKITFKEGQRITDYAKEIADNTNNNYEDVIKAFEDREYVKTLMSSYWFLTDSILDSSIYYPLEGYLAPDTYHFKNKDVSLDDIIKTMLNEMEKKLEKYKGVISKDVHYYMTMASIIELEGTNTENRKMIAGVFENRLNSGMNLGSDVTTYYGLQAAMTSDLTTEQFASSNGYNTRGANMIGKMPIGPICSPSESSIEAASNPTDSDYLFFVADKNGNIYYTKTNKEHEAKVAEIKANGDWIW